MSDGTAVIIAAIITGGLALVTAIWKWVPQRTMGDGEGERDNHKVEVERRLGAVEKDNAVTREQVRGLTHSVDILRGELVTTNNMIRELLRDIHEDRDEGRKL